VPQLDRPAAQVDLGVVVEDDIGPRGPARVRELVDHLEPAAVEDLGDQPADDRLLASGMLFSRGWRSTS